LTEIVSPLHGNPPHYLDVMAGLVPAIHVYVCQGAQRKTWMPGTRPGMTSQEL
jgi:hypothetical protein